MPRALWYGALGVLVAGMAWAQSLTPRTVPLDTFTCKELLSLPGPRQDRLLIYLNGYFDGMRRASIWDERLTGERIERAVGDCKSKPERPVLEVFADAWSR